MGELDQFLKQPAGDAETTLPTSGADVASFLSGDQDAQKLKLSVQQGMQQEPAAAQRLLRMQTETGLPKDYLGRNLDAVEAEMKQQAFDPVAYRKTSPAFAAWLSEHPDHAAAAQEDLTKLNYLERQMKYIGLQHESGGLQLEHADLGAKAMSDTITPADRVRQAAIEQRMQEINQLGQGTDITGFAEQIPGAMAQQAPIFLRSLSGKVQHGAEGAVLGGAAGAVAGAATANPALPAAGVALGTLSGWRYGAAIEAGKLEMHEALLGYEKLKDSNGQPLDRTTIKGLALMVGVVNGSLEGLTGIEALANKLPGIQSLTREGIKDLLKTTTTRAAVLTYAKTIGDVMLTEGATEALQMFVTKAGGVFGQALKDGGSPMDMLGQIFSQENVSQAIQEARAGAQGGGGLSMPMAAPGLVADLKDVKRAQAMRETFLGIGEAAAGTNLSTKLPGTLRHIMEQATKDGPVETLYVPMDSFNTYFQTKGVDPREVAKQLTGDVDAYDLAQKTGQDLAIKTADYAEKIAGTEHNAFFAQEVRPALAAMNAREADEWIQRRIEEEHAQKQEADLAGKEDPSLQIRRDIASQLESLGFDPAVVDQYAQMYQSRYQARAERRGLGENPHELFQKMGLNIQRELPSILQKVGSQTTEMDALLDRIRSGDVPTEGQIYGKSLFDALRERGGVQDQGGELSNLGVDEQRRPFVKKLVQEQGLSLDRAAEVMAEAGYIQEPEIQHLLDALNHEAGGKAVYVPGRENALLLDVSHKLADLQHYLNEQGVDLSATSNEAVKQMLDKAMATQDSPAEGQTFEQGPVPKAPTFYSKLEQVVMEKMGGKMPVADFKKMLAANAIKDDELKWTGLDDFLKGKDTVTKADVTDFLAKNKVEIKEVVLGDAAPGITEEQFFERHKADIAELQSMGWGVSVLDETGDGNVDRIAFFDVGEAEEEAGVPDLVTYDEMPGMRPNGHHTSPRALGASLARAVEHPAGENDRSAVKFANWKEPGGEHYREILLTLPDVSTPLAPHEITATISEDGKSWRVKSDDGRHVTFVPSMRAGVPVTEQDAMFQAWGEINAERRNQEDGAFTSGHYQVPNVLAHVRVDDRVDSQGSKVLYVEEVQSDWHQKARDVRKEEVKRRAKAAGAAKGSDAYKAIDESVPDDFGYRKKWAEEEIAKFRVVDPDASGKSEGLGNTSNESDYVVFDGQGNVLATPPKRFNESAEAALKLVQDSARTGKLHGMGKFPDAPFKKTWHELALKWLLRHAAEKGFDVMAWTTGEIQAKRYDLSKQIDEIAYEKNNDGTYHLWVKPIGSSSTDQIRETDLSSIPEAGLADVVGKDLAHKIVSGEGVRRIDDAREHDIEQVTGATRTGDGSVVRWKDGSESHFDSAVEAKKALLDEYAKALGMFDRGEGGRRSFSGLDLKVGGSGMKGFYDKVIPSFLNKYGKKWGAKVEVVELEAKGAAAFTIVETPDGAGPFSVYAVADQWRMDPPEFEAQSRAEAEKWVAEHTTKQAPERPVFREIARHEWDGLGGAEAWENGDKPMVAATKVRIAGDDYDVQVVVSPGGISIVGGDGVEVSTFEYAVEGTGDIRDSRTFRGGWLDSQLRATSRVLELWPQSESDLWLEMTPMIGMDRLDSADRARIGPVPDVPAVKLEAQAIPITEAMKESVLKSGQALFQSGGKDAKGQITFGHGRIDIALLEKADLSTFIHETGHLYLNELIDDATTTGVPQQLRDDLDAVLAWMGVTARVADGAEAIRAAMQTEQHEQFARGFEAYAIEGQSPSVAMREVFARFRQWLIQVYKLMSFRGGATPENAGKVLQVNLTPEVRRVLNRMVATEEEITAMEQEASVLPMFTDAASAGMTDGEFAQYKDRVAKAGMLARETLQAQVMAQLARERTAWWKDELEKVKAEVLASTNQRPIYIALSVLQDGTMPDGSALPEGLVAGKLSRRAVAALLGRDFVRRLPRGTTVATGGVSPSHAAGLFGYASPEEFLTELANVQPKNQLIESEAYLRMTREHGDPLIDGTLHAKAREAVLNAEREEVIDTEIAALDKKRREVTQTALSALMPPVASVREMARQQIARQRVREIKPQGHFLAAQKANRAAAEALWKRDYLAAGLAKQRELLNLALYRESVAALEDVQKIVQHLQGLRTVAKQQKIGKAGADYLEQLNAIMERYEFSPIPLIDQKRRQSLREWVAEKEQKGETLGEEFSIPEDILLEARTMNYKELPYEELIGIRDTIVQIEHFARLKNQMLAQEKAQEKEEARTDLLGALLAHVPTRPPGPLTQSGLTKREKASKLARQFDASLLKMEQVVEWLDGGTTGPWHDYLWDPVVSAQSAEADYTERITGKIAEAVVNIPAEIRSKMLDVVVVPGIRERMTRKDLLGVALNVGNDSNKFKLQKGMDWSEMNLRDLLAQLTEPEWHFVQQVWDTLESMSPDIDALQRKLTGLPLQKVVATPVQTKFGEFRGGYYPVMYSAVLSSQGGMQLSSTMGKLADDNYVKATLPSGYRKARIEDFARPFDLDVDRLPSHIAGMLHDLTHRTWLIDANWVVTDPKIRAALQQTVGDELTLRIAEWVGQVANDRNGNSARSLSGWMRLIEGFRMNTVIVAMGFKFSTMASQLAGVAPAIEVLGGKDGGGLKWFGVGVSDALRRPQSTYDFMTAKSGEMRHRITNRDRDLRDKLRALEGRQDLLAEIQRVSLMGIGYMELMISMPTWMGGYKKALDEGLSDEAAVSAGDRAVRLSQGAAGAKDLAAVAAKSDTMMRLITMFYTPFSALYNRLRSIGHDVEGVRDLPRAAVRLWLTVTVAATLGELLAGHGPDKDESWWRWWIRVQAMYPFLAIPLLRDAISTIVTGYGYQFSPVAQAIETSTNLATGVKKVMMGDKEWEDLALQSVKAFSYFAGLPTSQLIITGKYLHDLSTHTESPDNIFEFAKKFLYSRPKE